MAGAPLVLVGIGLMGLQLWFSIRTRSERRDRTLDWSTSSLPPAWKFCLLPRARGADPYWGTKQARREARDEQWRSPGR